MTGAGNVEKDDREMSFLQSSQDNMVSWNLLNSMPFKQDPASKNEDGRSHCRTWF